MDGSKGASGATGRVLAVSPTIQRFRGEDYWLCGKYFQRYGVRLHRAVWEHFNGAIPADHHVHHVDEDRGNNSIENLACIKGSEHISAHSRELGRRGVLRANLEKGREAAAAWHASEEGREWHRQHAIEIADQASRPAVCDECGASYVSRCPRGRFCSQRCHNRDGARTFRARRRLLRDGTGA